MHFVAYLRDGSSDIAVEASGQRAGIVVRAISLAALDFPEAQKRNDRRYHRERCPMPDVTYEIVQHEAYKVDGVFSETFPTHAEALAAAEAAAEEQEVPGHTETIEYQDDKGKWHTGWKAEHLALPRPCGR
jgi:hypothetical protein